MHSNRITNKIIGVLFCCCLTLLLNGQYAPCIKGKLLDQFSLDPLRWVQVSLLQEGALVASQFTNATGHFVFNDLPLGHYELVSCQQGLSTLRIQPIQLSEEEQVINLTILVEAESFDSDTLVFSITTLPTLPKAHHSKRYRRRTITRQHRNAFLRRRSQ